MNKTDLLISRLSIRISETSREHVFKLLEQLDQKTQDRLMKVDIDTRFSKELAITLIAWKMYRKIIKGGG